MLFIEQTSKIPEQLIVLSRVLALTKNRNFDLSNSLRLEVVGSQAICNLDLLNYWIAKRRRDSSSASSNAAANST